MARPEVPEKACYICKVKPDLLYTEFWRSRFSGWICKTCHPPISKGQVVEEISILISRDSDVVEEFVTGKQAMRKSLEAVSKLFEPLEGYFNLAYEWIKSQPVLFNEINKSQEMMDQAAADGKSDNFTRECSVRYFRAWRNACWWATRFILENMDVDGRIPKTLQPTGEDGDNAARNWKTPAGFQAEMPDNAG